MSDGSDQPKPSAQSANPFANPLSSSSGQVANPFAASQLAGNPAAPAAPAASVNPFAAPAAPAAPAASVNPFAAPAAPVAPAAPAAPAASVNPFAAPAAPASPAASVNPFAAPAAPASPAASVNPFAAPAAPASPASPAASVNPFAAPSEPVAAPSEDASSSSSAPSATGLSQAAEAPAEEGPSQDQLQQLNPFRMAAAQEPSAEELQALAGDFKLSLVPKKTVVTYALGAGVAALVLGLLIGGLASGRSEHTKRVVAWKQIDRELKKPLAQVKQLETSVNAIVEGIKKKELKWDQVKAIPIKFEEVKFSLLAPGVSMSQVAMLKLSSLLIKMDDTFREAASYRRTTLQDKGALTQILEGKDFSARPVHAIHVDNYLNNCLNRRGRAVCTTFDSLKRGSGRVVALTSAKLKKGKLSVVSRDSTEPFDVNVSELVLVPRPDIVGSGVNAMTVHDQSFGRLQAKLAALLKTRVEFERILQEKLTLE